jgi:hypothetical protein
MSGSNGFVSAFGWEALEKSVIRDEISSIRFLAARFECEGKALPTGEEITPLNRAIGGLWRSLSVRSSPVSEFFGPSRQFKL